MAEKEAVSTTSATPAEQEPQAEGTTKKTTRKRTIRRRTSKKAAKSVFVKSKRKTSVARAYVSAGTGRITVNSFSLDTLEPKELREEILEPMRTFPAVNEIAKSVDVKVSVHGGGQSSQAQAVRGAITKGLIGYSGDDALRRELLNYDRSMLVDDPRRVEPKKFKGPKARARFQKSYR